MRLVLKIASSALLAAGLALIAAPSAQAVPFVNGSVGFSGNLAVNTGASQTSIVSQLNVANPTTINLGSCTFDFSGCTNPGDGPINVVSAFGNIIFHLDTGGGTDTWNFQHTLDVVGSLQRTPLSCIGGGVNTCNDAIQVTLQGSVVDTLGTRQASLFTGIYNASGSCTDVNNPGTCDAGSEVGTWQVTLSAAQLPPPTIPEPMSLSLLGVALVGFGSIRRFARRS